MSDEIMTRLAALEGRVFDRNATIDHLREVTTRHEERWTQADRTLDRIEKRVISTEETNAVLARAVEKMATIQDINEKRLDQIEHDGRARTATSTADMKKVIWWFLGIVAALVVGLVVGLAAK